MIDVLTHANVRRWSLQTFLVLMFFVYYQTIGVPGTLHAWALLGGFALTLPTLIQRFIAANFRVPIDYALVWFMGLVMIVGFAVNYGTATALQLQAYPLSLTTYLFVRENAPYLSVEWFHRLMIIFLAINSHLIVLQF